MPKKSHNSFLYRKEIVEIRPSTKGPAFAINVIVFKSTTASRFEIHSIFLSSG